MKVGKSKKMMNKEVEVEKVVERAREAEVEKRRWQVRMNKAVQL